MSLAHLFTPSALPALPALPATPLTEDDRATMLADALARHRQALLAAVVGDGTIGGHDARRVYRAGVARLLGDLADEAGAGCS